MLVVQTISLASEAAVQKVRYHQLLAEGLPEQKLPCVLAANQ